MTLNLKADQWRVMAIAACLSTAYLVGVHRWTGLRAAGDSSTNILGAVHVLRTGHLSAGYQSGDAYEAFAAVLWRVLGVGHWATDWLSPLIAIVAITALCGFSLSILRHHDVMPAALALIVPLGFLAVPELLSQYRETSHKLLTFSLLYVIVYLYCRPLAPTSEAHRRQFVLLAICLLTAFLSNYIWSTIFIAGLAIAMAIDRRGRRIPGFAAITITASAAIFYLPGIKLLHAIRRGGFLALSALSAVLSGINPSGLSHASPSTGMLLSDYARIPGTDLPIWLIYSVGLFVVVALGGLVFCVGVRQWYRSKLSRVPILQLYLSMALVYGTGIVITLSMADIAVFAKRLLRPLLTLALFAGSVVLGRDDLLEPLTRFRRVLAIGVITLLVVSAPLSLGRTASDGTTASSDYWGGEPAQAAAAWAAQYSSPPTDYGDRNIGSQTRAVREIAMKYERQPLVRIPQDSSGRTLNRVYHATKSATISDA